MARIKTANEIINATALEMGLNKSNDPVADTDENFIQLTGLLSAAGQEMVELHEWQILQKKFEFTTQGTDTGKYDLPVDFAYMIDQTGWDRSNRVAIGGPLGPQDWAYLEGRDLVSQSIYASFRLVENQLWLYPQPPPVGLVVSFIYMGRNWVEEAGGDFRDDVGAGNDKILYEPILIQKFLKCKWLEAKGFDPSSARLEFENMLNARLGRDMGAPILSASRNSRGFPYLHPYYNVADTGYGIP